MIKKLMLILSLTVSIFSFGEKEIPNEVEREIKSAMAIMFDSGEGDSRKDYYENQKEAYIVIENELNNSNLTEGEKKAVRKRLKGMYGVNYVAQRKELKEEMQYVAAVNRENREKQEAFVKNVQSSEELKTIIQEAEVVVPKKYMEHFKSEAERLYPNNSYEQKRYIESSINTYKKFN